MRCWGIIGTALIVHAFGAVAQTRPQLYFPALTQVMDLKIPEPKGGEYEIRVWQKCQLCFSEAHVLYQLTKMGENVSLSKYEMRFNKKRLTNMTKTTVRGAAANELWQRLVQQGILTLPDEAVITNELHPRQQRDSTWSTVDPDGVVSVHAREIKRSVWILDGESYYFEIFGPDGYRAYEYGNPYGYIKNRPDIVELQKVVSVLDALKNAL